MTGVKLVPDLRERIARVIDPKEWALDDLAKTRGVRAAFIYQSLALADAILAMIAASSPLTVQGVSEGTGSSVAESTGGLHGPLTAWAARQSAMEGAFKDPRPVVCRSCGWVGERRQNRRACPKCHGGRVEWVPGFPAASGAGVPRMTRQGNPATDDLNPSLPKEI